MSPQKVCVDHNSRGEWELALPHQAGRVTCETLDDARRVAYLCAARLQPCELIIRDARHRVLDRELIDGPS
jgi:hypothetical protein